MFLSLLAFRTRRLGQAKVILCQARNVHQFLELRDTLPDSLLQLDQLLVFTTIEHIRNSQDYITYSIKINRPGYNM